MGTITKLSKDHMEVELKEPVATWPNFRVALSRRVLGRWRLSGWGIIESVASKGA